MDLREFGRNGLFVTPLGLGLAALGRPGYINLGHARDLEGKYDVSMMEQNAHEVMDAVALAAVLNQPWVDGVLSGATTIAQLQSNVKALDIKGTFELDGLLWDMKEPAAVYWAKRSQLVWN